MEAYKTTKTVLEFTRALTKLNASYALQNIQKIQQFYPYLGEESSKEHKSDFKLDQYNVPQGVRTWVTNEAGKTRRAKALVIVGPTRVGKTEMIRAMFPKAIYCRTHTSLQNFLDRKGGEQVFIFDDVDWDEMKYNAKAYLTQMGEQTLTDKYLPKKQVNIDLPAIYLMNERNHEKLTQDMEYETYWKANMQFEILDATPLYGNTQTYITTSIPSSFGPNSRAP